MITYMILITPVPISYILHLFISYLYTLWIHYTYPILCNLVISAPFKLRFPIHLQSGPKCYLYLLFSHDQ